MIQCILCKVILLSIHFLSLVSTLHVLNCLDDVHEYLTTSTPSMFDVFPFVCFVFVCVCLFLISLSCVYVVLVWLCFALLFKFVQEYKRVNVGDFDDSLFSSILLPFCAHLDGCFVLSCLSLVHFHLLGFI